MPPCAPVVPPLPLVRGEPVNSHTHLEEKPLDRRRSVRSTTAGGGRSYHLRLLLLFLCVCTPTVGFGAPPHRRKAAPPAEERRLGQATFRNGLRKRGLTDLLEQHLRDFPPAGELQALLMQREVKLAVHADAARPEEARRRALTEANAILDTLIHRHRQNPRVFQWRFDLAHSLLYDEAESLIALALYRGLNRQDRENLQELTGRAIRLLSDLLRQLAIEYERLEGLSVSEFDRLEKSGHVERVDRLGPQADYLLLWARFYNALPRHDTDEMRARQLVRIRDYFKKHPVVLETPHAASGVQVQALVLAGMVHRLLNRHAKARLYLDRAIALSRRIAKSDERDHVQWAVTLASIERIRNERDDGRFQAALEGVAKFRDAADRHGGDAFGMALIAALVERSILGAQKARKPDRRAVDPWQPLVRLTKRYPKRRDEVYAALYKAIDPDAAPDALDAYEQNAVIAGLLTELGDSPAPDDPRLTRIVQIGEAFLGRDATQTRDLRPEVLFNLGVAAYRGGAVEQAIQRFLRVSRDHVTWERAEQAAIYAVQLASGRYEQDRDDAAARSDYRAALETLVTYYPQSKAARYWRFFFAQLLEERIALTQAAAQYALVDQKHEHFLDAFFSRVRCLALVFHKAAAQSPDDQLELRRHANDFFNVQRAFLAHVGAVTGASDDDRESARRKMLATRVKLMAAEMQVLPVIDRPNQALDALANIEDAHDDPTPILGRVWRVRLLAYERLGMLDEASRAVPTFLSADPDRAGPTLQQLYVTVSQDAEALHRRGEKDAAALKADFAHVLAERILAWSEEFSGDSPVGSVRSLTIQLAEAKLAAGRYREARDLFARYLTEGDSDGSIRESKDSRVVFGFAEAQFQLGEWHDALVRFNRLAMELAPDESLRMRALLRDLQCRTELAHPPTEIIKVIQQQRQMFPDLGGPHLAAEFDRLQRENQQRAERGT